MFNIEVLAPPPPFSKGDILKAGALMLLIRICTTEATPDANLKLALSILARICTQKDVAREITAVPGFLGNICKGLSSPHNGVVHAAVCLCMQLVLMGSSAAVVDAGTISPIVHIICRKGGIRGGAADQNSGDDYAQAHCGGPCRLPGFVLLRGHPSSHPPAHD